MRQKPSNALRGCTELANRHPADYRFLQTRAWRDHIRPHQLAKHPVCAACAAQGRVSLAQEVDHIVPPNGNQALMRDPSNFQSLCKPCHSRKTRAQARGYSIAIGVDGYPIDPSHPSIEFDRRYGPWGAKTDEAD